MCGTMAMMAFVSIVGSLSRQLGLAPWQAGMSVTVSGVLWMLMSPVWGRRSDRQGRRAVMLTGFAGFFVSYCAMSGWLVAAMRMPMSVGLVFAGLVLTRGAIGGFYAAAPTASQALTTCRPSGAWPRWHRWAQPMERVWCWGLHWRRSSRTSGWRRRSI